MGYRCRIFTPAQPVCPAASLRDFLSGAYSYAKAANDLISDAPAFAGTMSSSNVATLGLALENRADGYAEIVILGPREDQRAG